MALQDTDLFYVQRGTDGFKIEYAQLQNNIQLAIESGAHVGDSAPDDPKEGDLWWNPDLEEFRVYVTGETTGVVTALGVRQGGSGYSAATGLETFGGHGVDLTVDITVNFDQVQTASPNNGGHGYDVGDVIFITGGGHANASLQVQTVNSVATGEWQLVNGKLTHPEEEITATDFDLSLTPFWRCGAITLPTPTKGENGQSGLIRFTDVPVAFASEFILPTNFSITAASVVPFYVKAADEILLGNPVEVS